MEFVRVFNVDRDVALADQVGVADTHWTRLRGLLGRPPLSPGEGLLLVPCRSVHMFGMKYPIDVAFLDDEGRVVAAYAELRPGKRSGWHGGARRALELPAGTLDRTGTQAGDTLALLPTGGNGDDPRSSSDKGSKDD